MSTNMDSNQEKPEKPEKRDEQMWAMLCHISAFAGFIVPYVGCAIGPLVIWMMKKAQYPLVEDQGKESLNFQISIMIYSMALWVLTFTIVLSFIAIPLLAVLAIFDIVEVVLAALKANDGVAYRYPLSIKLIR